MASQVVGNRDSRYPQGSVDLKAFVHLLCQILSSGWSQVQVPEMVSQLGASHPFPTPLTR